mmetsp:Transcript_107049/g.341596  ORF Transcript_107049/g.341596 Transcript_107049/m.341596 type:complete len:245 (-) Transcript_107049:399-1133(-)
MLRQVREPVLHEHCRDKVPNLALVPNQIAGLIFVAQPEMLQGRSHQGAGLHHPSHLGPEMAIGHGDGSEGLGQSLDVNRHPRAVRDLRLANARRPVARHPFLDAHRRPWRRRAKAVQGLWPGTVTPRGADRDGHSLRGQDRRREGTAVGEVAHQAGRVAGRSAHVCLPGGRGGRHRIRGALHGVGAPVAAGRHREGLGSGLGGLHVEGRAHDDLHEIDTLFNAQARVAVRVEHRIQLVHLLLRG